MRYRPCFRWHTIVSVIFEKEYIFMVAALVIWIILMCAFFWLLEVVKEAWHENRSRYIKSVR